MKPFSIETRWFKLIVGQANWLSGYEYLPPCVRLMWLPRPPAVVQPYQEIPCAFDGWVFLTFLKRNIWIAHHRPGIQRIVSRWLSFRVNQWRYKPA